MAIGVVATIKIQPGKNAEFEAAAKEMMAAVRANEPGNSLYSFAKSRKEAEDAVEIARTTSGVQRVVKLFEYID